MDKKNKRLAKRMKVITAGEWEMGAEQDPTTFSLCFKKTYDVLKLHTFF